MFRKLFESFFGKNDSNQTSHKEFYDAVLNRAYKEEKESIVEVEKTAKNARAARSTVSFIREVVGLDEANKITIAFANRAKLADEKAERAERLARYRAESASTFREALVQVDLFRRCILKHKQPDKHDIERCEAGLSTSLDSVTRKDPNMTGTPFFWRTSGDQAYFAALAHKEDFLNKQGLGKKPR